MKVPGLCSARAVRKPAPAGHPGARSVGWPAAPIRLFSPVETAECVSPSACAEGAGTGAVRTGERSGRSPDVRRLHGGTSNTGALSGDASAGQMLAAVGDKLQVLVRDGTGLASRRRRSWLADSTSKVRCRSALRSGASRRPVRWREAGRPRRPSAVAPAALWKDGESLGDLWLDSVSEPSRTGREERREAGEEGSVHRWRAPA